MRNHIADYLALAGHHTRSIALDRDLSDDSFADGYLLTPNAISALRQIGDGLSNGRAQRAWKIVGPYGSGKSALGVVLAQLLAGPKQHAAIAQSLAEIAPSVAEQFKTSNRFSLAVVGARVSFGVALASAINLALPNFGKTKAVATFRKQLEMETGTYKGIPFNAAAGDMAKDLANVVVASGFEGMALLIDEVGKFVEYAALYPEHGDLIALQQVAEHACKANDNKLVVVAMLHQHFASYAAGVGRALNDEWHKVAARFEEIPFDEPVERYAHFGAHALGVKPTLFESGALVSESRATYAKALDIGILRAPSTTDKALFEKAESLYPLHPVALVALAMVSKRYGQSERSFHAFLKGNEPKALREFAETHAPGSWYRLPELYDFLAESYSLRFRDLGAERRWVFAQAAIDRETQDAVALGVLKSIAVLELIQAGINTPITAELVTYALGEGDITAVTRALSRLVDQRILISRRKHAEYSFAISEAVNIEAIFETAARRNENDLIVTGITQALSQRHIVANRHYDLTGTIRTMSIVVGTPDAWPKTPSLGSDDVQPDAWLKLVLITKGSSSEAEVLQRFQREEDPLSTWACLVLSNEGRAALAEFAIWRSVLHEVNSKRIDPWSSRYVEGRLQEAADAVERLVTSALIPSEQNIGPTYWHRCKAIPGSELMNTSQVASWVFGDLYNYAPRIVNELINKDKPASAIVLARQRIFDVILSGDSTRKICGDTEYPPERLIHSTLLRQTGIWKESIEGHWILQAPNQSAETNITAVWNEIARQLQDNEPKGFSEVLEALAAPPFGVRNGPASIWLVLYLLINRSQCAVFERGTLVLELTPEHLQRLFRNPAPFTVRELPPIEDNKRALVDYEQALAAVGCTIEKKESYLEIARIFSRWYIRLPDFTKQTQRISRDAILIRSLIVRATDPIELLTQTLPQAHIESKSKDDFLPWITNALSSMGMALRNLQQEVAKELGLNFSITGSLTDVRNQLQAECTKEASNLADSTLKSFILRCTDLQLTDEKWLDSVASLIVQRPLDSWSDDTLSKFREGISELSGRYQRWMQVIIRRGSAPRAASRYVGLTLTMAGGQERSVFVATDESSNSIAKDLLALVNKSTNGNADQAAAALAQALLEIQMAADTKDEAKSNHG